MEVQPFVAAQSQEDINTNFSLYFSEKNYSTWLGMFGSLILN